MEIIRLPPRQPSHNFILLFPTPITTLSSISVSPLWRGYVDPSDTITGGDMMAPERQRFRFEAYEVMQITL